MHEVIDAKFIGEYRIRFTFDDLKSGEIDCSDFLRGKVFEPLRESNNFQKFRVDSDLGTIVWFNGADISPDTLYSCLKSS